MTAPPNMAKEHEEMVENDFSELIARGQSHDTVNKKYDELS